MAITVRLPKQKEEKYITRSVPASKFPEAKLRSPVVTLEDLDKPITITQITKESN